MEEEEEEEEEEEVEVAEKEVKEVERRMRTHRAGSECLMTIITQPSHLKKKKIH